MFEPRYTKPHYKSVIFASYLNLLKQEYPTIDIASIAKDAGLSLEYISDENNWVSIEFEKRMMDLIVERTGNPNIFYQAGQFGMSKTGLGSVLHFLVSKVLSLDTVYKMLPNFTSLLNKVMSVNVVEIKPGHLLFRFIPKVEGLSPDEAEILTSRMPIVMENTKGYYSAIPTLKRLPAAETNAVLSDPERSEYTLEVRYFARSEIINKAIHSIPFLISSVVFTLLAGFTNLGWLQSLETSALCLATLVSVFLKMKNRALNQVASHAEVSMFQMDRQYQDLYKTQKKLKRKLEETKAIFELVSSLIMATTEEEVTQMGCESLVTNLNYDRAFLLLSDPADQTLSLSVSVGVDPEMKQILSKMKLPINIDDPDPTKFSNILRMRSPLLVGDVKNHLKKLTDDVSRRVLEISRSESFVAVPVCTNSSSFGILVADCVTRNKVMTEDDLHLISTAGSQIAIAIEQQRSKQQLYEAYKHEQMLSESYSRFVPFETLKLLNYENIFDVKIGDGVEHQVSVMFSDIRDFTSLCESMTPLEILKFLNSYYGRLSPIIKAHGGTIDKYMGDGLMALFPSFTAALKAGVEIQRMILSYNLQHRVTTRVPIRAGVGIASGRVVFGPLGSDKRLELTAISDTVNVASRLDGLCRTHDADILISGVDLSTLSDVEALHYKNLGSMKVKGKSLEVEVIEIVDGSLLDSVVPDSSSALKLQYVDSVKSKLDAKMGGAAPLNMKKSAA